MSAPHPDGAPVGVRPATGVAGANPGQVRWVAPGSFALAPGDRVLVQEHGAEWLAEVVVAPERLVEWPELAPLPTVIRRALPAEWPATAPTDGRRLLESLGLPPDLLSPHEGRERR
jgi:hypothetical protein